MSQRQLKVLALIDHLVLGGAEMLMSQFAAVAPRFGITPAVACLQELDGNPAAAPLCEAGIVPINLDAVGRRPGPRSVMTVRRFLARTRPDLVHTHLGTSDWIGSLASRSLKIPVVSTLHTAAWSTDLELQAKRLVVRFCVDRVIAVSDYAKRAYEAHHWARAGQLVVIRNGVEATPAPGSGPEVRRELGWGDDHLVVGMISALRPEKAHDVAVDAVRLLLSRFPTLRLMIVGQGDMKNAIADQARDLGDVVAMTGLRNDVMRCLDACDVCLHPSRIEAFPTTLIEAMAASVPVLATNVGGIPEIVSDGETGVLIEGPPSPEGVAAALATLLEDPARRRTLGAAGQRDYEQNFTADRWMRTTRETYDEVLAERD